MATPFDEERDRFPFERLEPLIRHGESHRVLYRGKKRPLASVLEMHTEESRNVMHDIFVHPDWPWATPECTEKRIPNETGICDPEHIAIVGAIWRSFFQEKIQNCIRTSESPSLITDPLSEPTRFANIEINIPSMPWGKEMAVGMLSEQNLATFLEQTDLRRNDTVRIHGAAYGACPTVFAIQLWSALHLGVCLQPCRVNTPGDTHYCSMRIEEKVSQRSTLENFQMGTLFDTLGTRKHGYGYTNFTKKISDADTLVLPDDDPLLMKAAFQ